MSFAIPRWLVPWLVGLGVAGTVLALVLAVRAYIQLRRAEYYVIREEARRAGLRATLGTLVLALLTVGSLFIPRQSSTPDPTTAPATPTEQPTPTLTPTRIMPTATATTTPTPQPTATEPFIPTSTPRATLPVTFTVPLSSAVPPPADARIEFWTLAQGATDTNQPVEPSTQFPEGIERVYLFLRYDGLLPRVPWTTIWYFNGKLLSGGTNLWTTQRPAGEWYVFLTLDGGFPVGEYEVQVWLSDRLQIRTFFSVVKAEE
jgi:hypothetical protein